MKRMLIAALIACLPGVAPAQQEVNSAPGGMLRVLDKTNGSVIDIEFARGEMRKIGLLEIKLEDCRYPAGNPAGDAFALLDIRYRDLEDLVFRGWMIASSPALNPMDHPRYDVWVLRCMTS